MHTYQKGFYLFILCSLMCILFNCKVCFCGPFFGCKIRPKKISITKLWKLHSWLTSSIIIELYVSSDSLMLEFKCCVSVSLSPSLFIEVFDGRNCVVLFAPSRCCPCFVNVNASENTKQFEFAAYWLGFDEKKNVSSCIKMSFMEPERQEFNLSNRLLCHFIFDVTIREMRISV